VIRRTILILALSAALSGCTANFYVYLTGDGAKLLTRPATQPAEIKHEAK
jgi:hypothetical protein